MIWMMVACGIEPGGAQRAPSWAPSVQPGDTTGPADPTAPQRSWAADPVAPDFDLAPPEPLVARLTADVLYGVFPLVVSFDASESELAPDGISFEWSFGDGAVSTDTAPTHTYLGQGVFEATLTLVEERTGAVSSAQAIIEVQAPSCPSAEEPEVWGHVDDTSLTELSGIASSPLEPGVWWVHEDSGNSPDLTAIDAWGATLSTWQLPDGWLDFEDLSIALDPATGTPTMFMGDIGDNGYNRDEIAVWVAEEPDPFTDGELDPLRMELIYPDGARNAETLLVDPISFDVYIVTKDYDGDAELYVKRAPHDSEGPFVLEDLGDLESESLVATGGSVSVDGTRIVLRDYSDTAYVWNRDGYLPLEEALLAEPCEIEIAGEPQGEAVAFTADGGGIVTISEGSAQALNYIGL
jgi:PKD repeat protein